MFFKFSILTITEIRLKQIQIVGPSKSLRAEVSISLIPPLAVSLSRRLSALSYSLTLPACFGFFPLLISVAVSLCLSLSLSIFRINHLLQNVSDAFLVAHGSWLMVHEDQFPLESGIR